MYICIYTNTVGHAFCLEIYWFKWPVGACFKAPVVSASRPIYPALFPWERLAFPRSLRKLLVYMYNGICYTADPILIFSSMLSLFMYILLFYNISRRLLINLNYPLFVYRNKNLLRYKQNVVMICLILR